MTSDVHHALPDYYAYLEILPDSSLEKIKEAYQRLSTDTQAKLNDPWTMQSALTIQNTILPGIQQHLLSGEQERAAYDQGREAQQLRQARRDELDDDEGLDDPLRLPFFFDPVNGYDVEQAAFSLRQIAYKLDIEWEQARIWLQDTSDEHHAFAGFLKMVAKRPRLAGRVEEILSALNQTDESARLGANEGVERCIALFDSSVERAHVAITAEHFDGKSIDAGGFIPDLPAQTEITLSHEGIRGCVFGTIESHTRWAVFPDNQASMRYALMPEGTKAEIGVSEIKLPLTLLIRDLPRGPEQRYIAELVVSMENYHPVRKIPLFVHIYIQPLPPRVFFEPQTSHKQPLLAGVSHRNRPAKVVVIPRNAGDEQAVPLVGRISSEEAGASAQPERFRANEPITLTIDNSHRPFGSNYEVVFKIDYGWTAGARGPGKLYVRGVLLPTVWQSLLRERSGGSRTGIALGVGLLAFLLGGGAGDLLAMYLSFWWFLFALFPLILLGMVRGAAKTLLGHKELSGVTNVRMAQVPNWILWWTPLGSGLSLALLCALLSSSPEAAFLVAGVVWFIAAAVFGFILDSKQPARQRSSE